MLAASDFDQERLAKTPRSAELLALDEKYRKLRKRAKPNIGELHAPPRRGTQPRSPI